MCSSYTLAVDARRIEAVPSEAIHFRTEPVRIGWGTGSLQVEHHWRGWDVTGDQRRQRCGEVTG